MSWRRTVILPDVVIQPVVDWPDDVITRCTNLFSELPAAWTDEYANTGAKDHSDGCNNTTTDTRPFYIFIVSGGQ